MSLFGDKDLANNAPKFQVASGLGVDANGEVLFSNTTADAFVTGLTLGVFGVSAGETEATGSQSCGWVLRTEGSGGRAGRVQEETIVAMGSITDDYEDVVYPDYTITILNNPQNVTANANEDVVFTVSATSTPIVTLEYQWYNANGNVSITGANTNSYTIYNVQSANSNTELYVTVTAGDITANSTIAKLTVV